MQPTGSGHSPDGRWWWDGTGWLRAWSPDGRNWFDGVRWVAVSRPRRGGPSDWPRRVVVALIGWLVALSVFPVSVLVAVYKLVPGQVLADSVLMRLAAIGVVCLAMTPVMGYHLGRDGRWLQTLWVAIIGTGMLTAWYVGLFLADQSDPSADNEAGAGAVILGFPSFVAILSLLAVGAGLAKAMARLHLKRGLQTSVP